MCVPMETVLDIGAAGVFYGGSTPSRCLVPEGAFAPRKLRHPAVPEAPDRVLTRRQPVVSRACLCAEKKENYGDLRPSPPGAPRSQNRGAEALAQRLREPRQGLALLRRGREDARDRTRRLLAGDRHP